MVEKDKEKTKNLQEQHKSKTFKHLQESETSYRQANKSGIGRLVKLITKTR